MVTLCSKFFTLSQASHSAVLLKFIKRELFFCSRTCLRGMCFIVVEVIQRQSLSVILDKCMCTCVKRERYIKAISKISYVSHFKNVAAREINDID